MFVFFFVCSEKKEPHTQFVITFHAWTDIPKGNVHKRKEWPADDLAFFRCYLNFKSVDFFSPFLRFVFTAFFNQNRLLFFFFSLQFYCLGVRFSADLFKKMKYIASATAVRAQWKCRKLKKWLLFFSMHTLSERKINQCSRVLEQPDMYVMMDEHLLLATLSAFRVLLLTCCLIV